MARFQFTIEYEGTRYSGWQVQNNARTVQGELIGAIAGALGDRNFEFVGSGRTDSGVHALYQVAHLEAPTMLAPHILKLKVNDLLPADVNVIEVTKAPPRFHSRHHALSRTYMYQICRRRTAFGKRYVWWVKDELNVRKMQEACAAFEGFHDFQSFTRDDPDEKSTTVELQECSLHEFGPLVIIRIRGSHFLWRMVRQMVGMIVETGRGTIDPSSIRELLRKASSFPATKTAPPSGLYLQFVQYDEREKIPPVQPTIWIP
ncbi:MAG: tRNA pseudouridine(38-40) synthase TruA [Candidatus Kapabacteria bacterium]|nr:tRNA pseudouridine(38-40) synthase TruA [Candidatus Kapabacteria bacterium]